MWFTVNGIEGGHSDAVVGDTQWHFVAVTLKERVVRFYIDGKPSGQAVMHNALASHGNYGLGGAAANIETDTGLRGSLAESLIFDRALDPEEIAKLYRRGRGPHRAMLEGLVAGYYFDEGRGTAAHDFSDHGRDGTLHGGARWVPASSPALTTGNASHPHAVQFDGQHYAKVEQSPKFTSGDFTISLWFNTRRSSDWAFLFMRGFSYRDQQGDIGLKLNRDSGELDFQARTADGQWLFGWDIPESRLRSPVRYGQWNHVVVTRRGAAYTMWMNGKRVGREKSAADISDADNSNPFIVSGIMGDGGAERPIQGDIDDFRIFRRCLSDKEIGTLYDRNGDAASLGGEGRVKIGPLVQGHDMNLPEGVRITPYAATAPHESAIHFDQSHYATVPRSTKFTSRDFTISLWFNPRRSSESQFLFMRHFYYRDQQGDIGLLLNRNSGNLDFEARTADNNWLFGWDVPESRLQSPVRYGQWNHVIVTRRGDTYTMWVNGKRVGREKSSADISDADNSNPFIVGGMAQKRWCKAQAPGRFGRLPYLPPLPLRQGNWHSLRPQRRCSFAGW